MEGPHLLGTALQSQKSSAGSKTQIGHPQPLERNTQLIVLRPHLGKRPCQGPEPPFPAGRYYEVYCVPDSSFDFLGASGEREWEEARAGIWPSRRIQTLSFMGSTFRDPKMWFDRDCAPARHLSYLLPVSCNSPPPFSFPGYLIWLTQRPGVSQVWAGLEPSPS